MTSTARTIAIGDIHGCSAALDAVLEAIDPAPEDLIVTLGDYVNRGPDSRGVLDRLIQLGQRCRHVAILGNHDEVLLEARRGRTSLATLIGMGGAATLESYGPGRDLSLIPGAHVEFLQSCRPFLETTTHIFTHANYLPDLPMSAQSPGVLRWESLKDTVPRPHVSGKTAILGHSSQKDGRVLDLGHLVCIDTFCHGGGWLTAMDVGDRRVWQADRQGKLRRS